MPVAVITGASRGLGAGIAKTFAAQGLQLGLCARRQPEVPGGSAGADAVTAAVDVTDAAAVEKFAAMVTERFGAIDLWINNAGAVSPIAPLADLDPADVSNILTVNIMGTVH